MDLLSNLALGFATALSPENIFWCFVGVLLGTLVGVLPGIGPTATIAMLLPITFGFEPVTALIMLAGIYYGAQYGGSTTAILINLPGESSAAVTAIDGHEMARQGRGGPALATAAIGSFVAGTIGTLVVVLFAPALASVALTFGSAEFFALVVLGLITSVALARGSTVKALAMIVLGLLLGTVGQDIYTGTPRFTFGMRELYGGINFVSVAVGMFGVAEILRNLEHEAHGDRVDPQRGQPLAHARGPPAHRPTDPAGHGLGSALGVLPGAGHVLASFASYTVEKRVSRDPRSFGHGAIEGVAGPESANNAAAQTSFIPLLTLGLPAHPVMALMVGAFIIQGITPGPNVIVNEPALFWGLIVSMWIGNLLLVLLNLPLIGIWVRLLAVPYRVLFPADHRVRLHRHVLDQPQPVRRVRDRVVRAARLRAHQAGLRAGAAPDRFRPRPIARAAPSPGADHRPRRPDGLRHAPGVARAPRHRRHRLPARGRAGHPSPAGGRVQEEPA